jgi:hypothetical protein
VHAEHGEGVGMARLQQRFEFGVGEHAGQSVGVSRERRGGVQAGAMPGSYDRSARPTAHAARAGTIGA